jgi:hypothetical protein
MEPRPLSSGIIQNIFQTFLMILENILFFWKVGIRKISYELLKFIL